MTIDSLSTPQAAPSARWELRRSGLFGTARKIVGGRLAIPSLVIIGVALLCAVAGPMLAPYDPLALDPANVSEGPTLEHPLGTDKLGRDILSRIIEGSRPTVTVGLGSVVVALVLGVPIGLLAGYFRGPLDYFLMRVMDAVYAFPALMLILSLIAVLGRGIVPLIIAISVINVPVFARILRAQVLVVKQRDFVHAARALGAPPWRILLQHILPNSYTPILVQSTILVGYAILAEASLNFLGLGVPPPQPTWGGELEAGFKYIRTDPLLSIFPGMTIFLVVLAFNLAGDALRDALDPKLRVGRDM